MKKISLTLAMLVAGLAVGAASDAADKAGRGRIGLGLNLGRADLRYDLDTMSAVDGFLDLSLGSGGAGFDETDFGIGGYYLRRMTKADPVGAHLLGGFRFGSRDEGGATFSDFTLFGGIGAEYFFPGTKQFSVEANVGLGIHFVNTKVKGLSATGTQLSIDDLTRGGIMLRYYFQ